MADVFRIIKGFLGLDAKQSTDIPIKYIDNGDGTFSEKVQIEGTVNAITSPDKETPTMLFRVKSGQSFAGASSGDPILAVLTINTVTNTLVSANPLWYNGNTKSQLNNADVDTSKLEAIAANSLTLSEFQTVFGNTSDDAATTDTGTFTFMSLVKRLLTKIPVIGQQLSAASRSVVQASDSVWVSENATRQLVSGSITTQNLNSGGVATPNSAVEMPVNTDSVIAIQVVGTYTGALSVQGQINATNWVTLGGTPILNLGTGAYSTTIASAVVGLFLVDCSGLSAIRLTALAAVTGSANISIKSVPGNALVAIGNALPTGTNAIGNITTLTTGNVQNIIPAAVADVASAAITASANTAAITPTYGQSYKIGLNVTAVSGTNPSMDIDVQESMDTGVTWKTVYTLRDITATGFYETPELQLSGNRIRYVQTISGTSPSFTRSVTRLQINTPVTKANIKQSSDLSGVITVNTTSSVIKVTEHTQQFFIKAIPTGTNPRYNLQIEESFNGIDFYPIFNWFAEVSSSTYTQKLGIKGAFIRYVETLEGTSPSISRSLARVESTDNAPVTKELMNPELDLNTLNSEWLINTVGLNDFYFSIRATALTTPATLTFYVGAQNVLKSVGTLVVDSTSLLEFSTQLNKRYANMRVRVTSAGTGITLYGNKAIMTE